MRTHNIDFNEDLTKIIFELSSNIIKYAPYFFCYLDILKQYLFYSDHQESSYNFKCILRGMDIRLLWPLVVEKTEVSRKNIHITSLLMLTCLT